MAYITPSYGIEIIFDEDGIPSVKYSSSAIYRNPVTISQTAMKYYQQYGDGNNSAKDYFLNCCDWFVENAAIRENYSVWIYDLPSLVYDIPQPFVSGMAQGLGVQTLLAAHNLTRDDKYMYAAKLAMKSFDVGVKEGGVTYRDKEGLWYEEYANPHFNKEPRVLNGFIFALLGIYDYWRATGDKNARELFELGFSDLKSHLSDYDTGSWTNYDSLGLRASTDYHNLHVDLLSNLYNITNDPDIKMFRDRWESYKGLPKNPLMDLIQSISEIAFRAYSRPKFTFYRLLDKLALT